MPIVPMEAHGVTVSATVSKAMGMTRACMPDVLNTTPAIMVDMRWCANFFSQVNMLQFNHLAHSACTICDTRPKAMIFTTQLHNMIRIPHVAVDNVAVPMCPFGV